MPNSSLGTYRKLFNIIFPNDDFSTEKLTELASELRNLSEDIDKLSEIVQAKSGGYSLTTAKQSWQISIYWF